MQKVPVPGMSKDGMEKHELEIIGLKHPHEQLSAVRLDLLDHHLFHSFTDDSCERGVFFFLLSLTVLHSADQDYLFGFLKTFLSTST